MTGLALPVAAGTNALVSAPGVPSASGAAGSYLGSFSPDGRYFVFVSHANNLATNDSNAQLLDVFARDLLNGTTTLVSLGTNGRTGGDDNSPFATMSTNGLVAFESNASNLVTNDTNRLSDVFLHNLLTGTTTAISVQSNGNRTAQGRSTAPLISQDGQRVIFESTALNLAAGDSNSFTDLYVRDLVARTTALVSRNATNAGFAAGPSDSASISADGRYVAFVKRATNNLPSNRRSEGEIYVRDLDAGTTIWASVDVNTNFIATIGYPYWCSNPVLSADGRYVAFFAEGASVGTVFGPHLFRRDLVNGITIRLASNVTNRFGIPMSADGQVLAWIVMGPNSPDSRFGLRVWDEASGTTTAVCLGGECATAPALSADGSQLAYFRQSAPPFPPLPPGLYVYHRAADTNGPVSVTTDQGLVLPAGAAAPAFSPDGHGLAFEGDEARLVPGDVNNASDVFLRSLDSNTTQLISAALPELPSASASGMASLAPGALSEDGRFLAFTALDGNLVPGDSNRQSDVFVRDLWTGGIVAASARAVSSLGGGKELLFDPNALTTSTAPVISGDGRVVAYRAWQPWATSAGVLYWRDLAADQPVAISPNNAISPTNTVALNHDGNLVVFDSDRSADVLSSSAIDFNNGSDVFLRDVAAGTNALISVNHAGTGTGNGPSIEPRLRPDGQWVAFLSRATDLTTNPPLAGVFNAYVRHLPSGRTRLLSRPDLLGGQPAQSYGLVFSAVANTLTFGVRAGFAFTNIYQHDLITDSTRLVCGGCQNPSVSGDGQIVAYDSLLNNASAFTRAIMAKDLATDFETLISVSTNGISPASMGSFIRPLVPQISRDGRYVVFFSQAPDLVSTDTNRLTDLFARDRIARRTFHLTLNSSGTDSANALSSVLVMAGDGRSIAIQSHASDLVSGDYNFRRDVFHLRLAEPDADGDGMDDDWEMAYFTTLARDGAGDFDSDGASDTQEFRAGTDPTNTGSIFRVISLAEAGGSYRLFWSTEPGLKYQVQYRNEEVRGDGWSNLGSPYTAASTTGSQLVHSATLTTNRFYRVVRLQ
jgi:Tol biopolymer transport system component